MPERSCRRRPGARCNSPVRGPVHLIFAMADHFEPAIDPEDGQKRVPRSEQERRLEWWAREYPKVVDSWRDHDGRPLVHTYFYPAEQYDEGLLEMLAEHCHAGWGEVEVHLHHGTSHPDTAENTRRAAHGIPRPAGLSPSLPRRRRRFHSSRLRFCARKFRARQLRRRTLLRRRFGNADSCRDRLLCRLHHAKRLLASGADRKK